MDPSIGDISRRVYNLYPFVYLIEVGTDPSSRRIQKETRINATVMTIIFANVMHVDQRLRSTERKTTVKTIDNDGKCYAKEYERKPLGL